MGAAATALVAALMTLPGTVTASAQAPALSSPRRLAVAAPQRRPAAAVPASAAVAPSAVLGQYCVTCHNARLKTAGFVLDPAGLANIGGTEAAQSAESWEKVVKKLRTTSMPPAGAPRPDAATYESVASFLETELDRASAARPRLGAKPLVHRLSRTEYQNAVRDLLALDALPKEVSVDLLLPQDNISSGFDNIADLLFVSPSNMERYLDAARKISRLAVGDPSMPVLVNIHTLDAEHPQDERVDALPFGTRGGIAVRSEFPVDGTYVVKVELAAAPREPHQLELTVDGERVQMVAVGTQAPAVGAQPRGAIAGGAAATLVIPGGVPAVPAASDTAAVLSDADAVAAGVSSVIAASRAARQGVPLPNLISEFRLVLKAGPKLVGVAFVQRTEARDEATLRPRTRSRGTQPAIAAVTISGPYSVTAPGNSPSRQRIFSCRPVSLAEEAPCARTILAALARRAYRRPVVDVDLRDLLPFYATGRAEGSFDLGIQRALERLLVSSQFLFRLERPQAAVGAGALYRVSDVEMASRLSFFLWSSIPDDELLSAAEAGRLSTPRMLEQQVRRMLADPRAESLVTNFAAQWLYLRDIELKLPDEVLFQDFDETLRAALRRETELFITSVFRDNRSVMELLTANYTFLNERLARHYGIPNVKGSYFRRVALPAGSVRGGLLGHGSVLTITSYATRTSPVLRGKWVLENLLSSAPPPPPPDIPALKTDGAEPGKPLTMRDAMIRHRANPACASCHARMDPIGFAMENFDAVGRWRDADGENGIDASGAFPDGTTFDGVVGLKRELLRHPEQFVGTIAERLLMYAVGRNLQYYDAPSVRAILREAALGKYSLSSLILGVVKSRPFQMREAS
jgi:mono/diheme cytochrome c family protein